MPRFSSRSLAVIEGGSRPSDSYTFLTNTGGIGSSEPAVTSRTRCESAAARAVDQPRSVEGGTCPPQRASANVSQRCALARSVTAVESVRTFA